jgi:hypothetical protein
LRHAWGWRTDEERRVTLGDLGLGLEDVSLRARDEVVAKAKLEGIARAGGTSSSSAFGRSSSSTTSS